VGYFKETQIGYGIPKRLLGSAIIFYNGYIVKTYPLYINKDIGNP